MNRTRIIIAGVLAIGAIIGFFAYSEYQRGHEEMTDLKADFSIATTEILSEYQADNAAANQKYLGKIVRISGTVSSVKALEDGGTNVVLKEGGNCAFLAEVKLQEGQEVNIQGECTGFMEEEMLEILEINLTRCAVVE